MKYLKFIFLIFIIVSCNKTFVKFSDMNQYKTFEPIYDAFYVVDTINIPNPIVIGHYKTGGRFVCADTIINNNDITESLFKRPDVFLLGNDLYRDLPLSKFDKFQYPDNGNCKFERIKSNDDYELLKYNSDSVKFILGLINGNYYNEKHNSYTYYPIKENNSINAFYKIVYPLCE